MKIFRKNTNQNHISGDRLCVVMRVIITASVLLSIMPSAKSASADDRQSNEVLSLGFSMDKPPFVLQAERKGLEYDIVIAAAKHAGYDVEPIFAPTERLEKMLKNKQLDGLVATGPYSGILASYSEPYILYYPVAVALCSRKLTIRSAEDLAGLSVISFQRASDVLDPNYQEMAKKNSRYWEVANLKTRNLMLYSGRVDVAVGDRRIFEHLNRVIADKVDTSQCVTWYDIFRPVTYQIGFIDPAVRSAFDRGLEEIREDGEYAAIQDRYRSPEDVMTVPPIAVP